MPPQEVTGASGAAATAASSSHPPPAEDEGATTPVPGLASLSLSSGDGDASGSSSDGSTRQPQQSRAPRPVRHATTTHRTVPLAEAVPRARAPTMPPSLVDLALAAIADRAAAIVDLQGLDEGLAVRLLGLILQRGKLDYRLCRVFMEAGHPALRDAVAGLNLYDGLACQKADGGGGAGRGFSPGGCR